jgi:hypothetical protein
MKLPLTGGCACGAIRYESTAEPAMMLPPVVEAYLRTYPSTQNRAGGRAGASRFSEILARLAELGCWRAKHV